MEYYQIMVTDSIKSGLKLYLATRLFTLSWEVLKCMSLLLPQHLSNLHPIQQAIHWMEMEKRSGQNI